MKMYDTSHRIEDYLDIRLECDCGRTHYASIKAIKICPGALNLIADYVRKFGYRKPYILCDKITYGIAAERCEQLLQEAGYEPKTLIIQKTGFDEATLGEIVLNKPDDCDVMIGVGTGSITDMLRFASFKLKLPCFTVPTAAPMDGFAASAGIMNVNNLKATMPAHCTEVILGDVDVISNAPYRMTMAGFSDLIGKLNALIDWRLDVLINDAHYCRNIDKLVSDYVNDILQKTDKLKRRDPDSIGDVLNALLLIGTTISLYGNSRPVSGAEHHMSHYWDTLGEQKGSIFGMHGEQAAVGTVLALMMLEELAQENIDFNAARESAGQYNADEWESEIRRAYGNAADAIIALENISRKNTTEERLKRLDRIEEKWPDIRQLISSAYSSEALRALLKELECPADPKDIGITKEILKDTFMYCKETRARYTSYQLAWDLGILDRLSDRIIDKLTERGAV